MFSSLKIPEVMVHTPRRWGDNRGWFQETWRSENFLPGVVSFAQENHSYSKKEGTIRGIHFQKSPAAQGKLLRVIRGSIIDVAVDLRVASPTFGKWVSAYLSSGNGTQIWIPEGFGHGFCTLSPDTEVVYKVTRPYSPAHERGICPIDQDLGVVWGYDGETTIAERDLLFPGIKELKAEDLFGG